MHEARWVWAALHVGALAAFGQACGGDAARGPTALDGSAANEDVASPPATDSSAPHSDADGEDGGSLNPPQGDAAMNPNPPTDAEAPSDAAPSQWTDEGPTVLLGDVMRMYAHPTEAGHLLLAASDGANAAVDWDNGVQNQSVGPVPGDNPEWIGGGFTAGGAEYAFVSVGSSGLFLASRAPGASWQWSGVANQGFPSWPPAGMTVGVATNGRPLLVGANGLYDYSTPSLPTYDALGAGLGGPQLDWAVQLPSGAVLVGTSTPSVVTCTIDPGQPLSCQANGVQGVPSVSYEYQLSAVTHFARQDFVLVGLAESAFAYSTDGGQSFASLPLSGLSGSLVDITFAPTGALRVVALTNDGGTSHVYSMAFAGGAPSGSWMELANVPTPSYAVAVDVADTLFVASSADLFSTTSF
jgi:hypothetical protein